MTLWRLSSLGIAIKKVYCIAMASIRTVEQTTFEFSFFQDSHSSANSTVFRIPILLVPEIFLCEAYRFQKTSQTSDAQKNTPSMLGFTMTNYLR